MDQARLESPNVGPRSAPRLVVLTPAAQIVAPLPAERAPGAVRRRPPTTATALLYALLKLVGYGPPPSFVQLPGLTWTGPGECECCGAYVSEPQRCGECGSTFRLSRPKVPFSQYLPAQRPRFSLFNCWDLYH